MLKTNSKIAREGVRAWIRNCYTPEGYDEAPAQDGSSNLVMRMERTLPPSQK